MAADGGTQGFVFLGLAGFHNLALQVGQFTANLLDVLDRFSLHFPQAGFALGDLRAHLLQLVFLLQVLHL